MTGTVVIVGAGDLGIRLALRLGQESRVRDVVLAGRFRRLMPAGKAMLRAASEGRVRFCEIDLLNQAAIEGLLKREQPDILLQCACLLSPWHLSNSMNPTYQSLISAGFCAMLPAQLPIALTVTAAAQAAYFRGAVINCSYPDVVNDVLARLGRAPMCGVGNVSMIRHRVIAALVATTQSKLTEAPLVRILAHHAHVSDAMRSEPPAAHLTRPIVLLGAEGARADELAYIDTPLIPGREWNELTCATAMPLILSLLDSRDELRTSVPGPFGLPGGFPVRVSNRKLTLDLPTSWKLDDAIEFQRASARSDGLSSIEDDGTIIYTAATAAILARLDPVLAEPLHPTMAYERFQRLQAIL